MLSPMQDQSMNNPQLFSQMLQQRGFSPQSNLMSKMPPMGGGAPTQPPMGMPQPPMGGAPAQPPMGGAPTQPPIGVPQPPMAGAQSPAAQMMKMPTQMQVPPLQSPNPAIPKPQNDGGGIDKQAQAAKLLEKIHQLEAVHGSPKPGSKQANQLQQLKAILLHGASGGKNIAGSQFTPQEAAALGRMGDKAVVHMTPGEMTVPKELQTPAMLKTMKKEYNKKGVDPSQFTVGSNKASVNPKTGMQEFSFWSSFLPSVGGILGGIFGGPLGAAAGSTVGGLAGGNNFGQSILGGATAGIGSYAGGQIFGNSGGLSNFFGDAASEGASAAGGAAAGGAGGSAASGLFGKLIAPNTTIGAAGMTGAGAMLGNMMYQPSQNGNLSPSLPPGFNTPLTPTNSLGNAEQQLGMANNKSYKPATFTNYDPNTNYTGAYNFYPSS